MEMSVGCSPNPCGRCPQLSSLGISTSTSRSLMYPRSPCYGCHCLFHRGDTDHEGHTGAALPSSEPRQPMGVKAPGHQVSPCWVGPSWNREECQVWGWGTWPGPTLPQRATWAAPSLLGLPSGQGWGGTESDEGGNCGFLHSQLKNHNLE